ncbi:MAG: ATP-binding protein [candidate division KSB1 bacterium]|nr:ATP-binding protein [candidate division KSB1 bacterium]
MKELVIISGKGGTGKTSLAASFAALAQNKVLADCDVDAADLHLILAPNIQHREDFYGGKKAFINQDKCTECGKCLEVCRFEAISADFVVDPISCEGCGVCVYFCPVQAIDFNENRSGERFISETRFGPMVHARLGVAEENSGKLVTLVRRQARLIAEKYGKELIIVDGAPGVGCPVIASITGADAVLVVTEPTLSGVHDLERVVSLAAGHFNIKTFVCVNKYDLNLAMTDRIEAYCRDKAIYFAGRIPYDDVVTEAMIHGKSVVEYSAGRTVEAIKKIWESMLELIHKPQS